MHKNKKKKESAIACLPACLGEREQDHICDLQLIPHVAGAGAA